MTFKSTVRAVDVGYGMTKFTLSDLDDAGEIRCSSFPSVAPLADAKNLDQFMDKKNTVKVQVAGQLYEVGPDSMLSMGPSSSRVLDLEFSKKDTYTALVRGALSYMNVDEIDMLVLGLPMTNVNAMAGQLAERMIGEHRISDQKSVLVKDVLVLPQPVGGLWDYSLRHAGTRQTQDGYTLLIDPGYFTMDWLVAHGTKGIPARCGAATNAGMAAILRAIADRLAAKLRARDGVVADITESVLARIDDSLRNNSEFRFHGKLESLADNFDSANHIITDALNKAREKIGSMADIDRILIVGGAANIYAKSVEAAFPGFDVRVVKDSQFANARGFQIYGLRKLMARAAA